MPYFLKLETATYSTCKSFFTPFDIGAPPEEFSWNGIYFGFHLRLFPRSPSEKDKLVRDCVDLISLDYIYKFFSSS